MIAKELKAILKSNRVVCRGRMHDTEYALPTRKWFTDAFPDELLKFYRKNKLVRYSWSKRSYSYRYVRLSNDCDDAARQAAVCAHMMNFKDGKKKSIAVGEFAYISSNGPHSVICAVLRGGKLAFLEPQTWKPIRLIQMEIQSCSFYRF